MTDISRRGFMKRVGVSSATIPALSALAAESKGTIPKRLLGRTKRQVSILAFGGGSRFLAYKDEETAIKILNHALDLGITYVDTAAAYGKGGESEKRIGKALGARRKDVFLATKVDERDYDTVMRTLEASLKRLQTDHLDLFHLHGLGPMEDLEKIEKTGGLKALYKARDQKMTNFIGMSCHQDGSVLKAAIERHDLDCVQMALNAARAGKLEELALPAANKKNLGIIAMKVTAQEKLLGAGEGKAAIESLVRYSLSLPVTACVVGMPKPEFLEQNVAIARAFKPLSPQEKDAIHQQVAATKVAVERFFWNHRDA